MPIYDYLCENGHQFEVMQRFSDPRLTSCEVCGAPVERVLHPPAIHFKGSGFHNTDYGTKKRNREKAAADRDSSSSDSGSDSKSSDATSKDAPAKSGAPKSD